MLEDLSITKSTAEDYSTDNQVTDRSTVNYATQQKKLSENVPYFTSLYIHVIEEPRSDDGCYKHEENLLREYEQREGPLTNLDSSEKSKEKYEKRQVADSDRVFHRFQKRLKRCPEQCLRYEWNGTPLNFSSKAQLSCEFNQVPVCSNCQSARVFELQLMPALSWALQVPDNDSEKFRTQVTCEKSLNGHLDSQPDQKPDSSGHPGFQKSITNGDLPLEACKRIEFGTLYIFTCSKSCNRTENGISKPVEEYIILQAFPDNNQMERAMNS